MDLFNLHKITRHDIDVVIYALLIRKDLMSFEKLVERK